MPHAYVYLCTLNGLKQSTDAVTQNNYPVRYSFSRDQNSKPIE